MLVEWLGTLADRSMLLLGAALFVIMMAAKEGGYYVARRWTQRENANESERAGVGIISGGMLALLAFLLAISLSIADRRYEDRRAVVLAEANAIGTAWLRAGAQDSDAGTAIQDLLKDYAEVRLEAITDFAKPEAASDRTLEMQDEIWAAAAAIARAKPDALSAQLLASLNEVFDLALSQRRALESRIPAHVMRQMFWVSVLTLAGLGFHLGMLDSRLFIMSNLLVVMWVSAIVLIVDIQRTDQGFVQPSYDPLVWTLETMRASNPNKDPS